MDLLKRVHLAEECDRQAKYLSHGQRQWLEITMLIVADPKLLLVDEPAAGLTDKKRSDRGIAPGAQGAAHDHGDRARHGICAAAGLAGDGAG